MTVRLPSGRAPRGLAKPALRDGSGFILVVVLVILLLMAIMAIAYLSVIRYRVQEISGGRAGNIQIVVSSVQGDIARALMQDYPALDAANQPAPYDYPWTNASKTNMPYMLARPSAGQARAGLTLGDPPHDDPWLAASLPTAGTNAWPHLSNLRGAFLDIANADLTKVPLDPTRQYVATDKPSANLESNVLLSDKRLVDTDGDGIGDAFWFYPSLSSLADRRYVAAVYIEDLSAKLNVNTALPLRTGGAYPADSANPAGAPVNKLGLSAADVDLSAAKELWPAITDAQLANLVALRCGAPGTPFPAAQPMDYLARYRYFAERACRAKTDGTPLANEDATIHQDAALYPETNGKRFGLGDEYQLRLNGGLTNPKTTTRLEAPALLGAALRVGHTENLYTDVDPTVDGYFRNNPRRWLTGFSGEVLDVKGFAHTAAGAYTLAQSAGINRVDLNAMLDDGTMRNLLVDWSGTPFYAGQSGVTGGATDPAVFPYPGSTNYPFPCSFVKMMGTTADTTSHAFWWAGNVQQNYYNATHRQTGSAATWTPGGLVYSPGTMCTFGGAHAPSLMPVLTEVYLQCAKVYYNNYNSGVGWVTDATVPAANADLPGTYRMWVQSWSANFGYCLELSNPYDAPVPLTNASWVADVVGLVSNGTVVTLDSQLPATWPYVDENGIKVLPPGHKLLLYRDGTRTASAIAPPAAMDTNITSAVSTAVNAAVAAAPSDPNIPGRKMVDAVNAPYVFNSASFGANYTTYPTQNQDNKANFLQFELRTNARTSPNAPIPHYLTVPFPVYCNQETSPASATWGPGLALGTPVGIQQCSARTWGLKEGLDVLQCRPARQSCLLMSMDTSAQGAALTPSASSSRNRDVSPMITPKTGRTPDDLGDAAMCYNRAFDAFDSTLLSTLGKNDKTGSRDDRFTKRGTYDYAAALNSGNRARIQGDHWWHANDDWYWGADSKIHYRWPLRVAGLADMMRIPNVWMWSYADGVNHRPASGAAGTGLQTFGDQGSYYTDTDLAHWLYFGLHDESQPATGDRRWPDVKALMAAGHPALDALRLHPWIDGATVFKPYSTTGTSSQKAPFSWLQEGLWSVGNPGYTGGLDWYAAANGTGYLPYGPNKKWVDGNNDNVGRDQNANQVKDWNFSTEIDLNEKTAHGRLNLNTAPVWLLEQALPVKDAALRKSLANLIDQSRRGAPDPAVRDPGDRGIAYMAELIPIVAKAAKAGTLTNWPVVPATNPKTGLANPASGPGAVGTPDVSLDAILNIIGPLWQTASPRSDYFAAHILVQGYQSNNFSTGALESARVLVIFRRDKSGAVPIGRYDY